MTWPTKEEREAENRVPTVCPYGCGEVRFQIKGSELDPWKHHELDCTAYGREED